MVSRVGVVIPVRGQHELTLAILSQLVMMEDWHECMVLNDGTDHETETVLYDARAFDKRVHYVSTPARGIYEKWSDGLDWACAQDCEYVAFLNNDLRLAPGTFAALASALDKEKRAAIAYPNYDLSTPWAGIRYTTGTYRHGGMSGFAFMLRAAAVDWSPLIDPRFQWWGGDDDLAFNLEARGWAQARVLGLHVEHLNEGTARHHPELAEQKARDLAAVLEKWGR